MGAPWVPIALFNPSVLATRTLNLALLSVSPYKFNNINLIIFWITCIVI